MVVSGLYMPHEFFMITAGATRAGRARFGSLSRVSYQRNCKFHASAKAQSHCESRHRRASSFCDLLFSWQGDIIGGGAEAGLPLWLETCIVVSLCI